MYILDIVLMMDSNSLHSAVLWNLLLIISYYSIGTNSDMGKVSNSQNHFVNVMQSQFTTKNNTRVIAQKGGLAVLPCVVKVNSPATVSWIRRKDFQLLTVGLSTHSSDKRFLVEHTRHMGHWSLRIKSVREDDRGFYECQLSIYPTQSIFVELKVVEAEAEIAGEPDLHIDEGSTLQLECNLKRATENPSFVFWYHNSKMVNYDAQDGFSVTSKVSIAPNSSKSSLYLQNGSTKNTIFGIGSFNITRTPISKIPMITPPAATLQYPPYLLTPSASFLTLQEVHFRHAGNYTCAPSNAKSASITVHVLRGERPAAMQHANRTMLDYEINNTTSNKSTSKMSPTIVQLIQLIIFGFHYVNLLMLLHNTPSDVKSFLVLAALLFDPLSIER